MMEFDEYCSNLIEEAKWFYQVGKLEDDDLKKQALLRGAVLIGISALEAYVNGIVDEVSLMNNFGIAEMSLLKEKDMSLIDGEYQLKDNLKMRRLVDRVSLLYRKYTQQIPKDTFWWIDLNNSIKTRNKMVHPKESIALSENEVDKYLTAILNCINDLFKAIYKKGLPTFGLELTSKL